MKKVAIIEYLNYVDEKFNPTGHGKKVFGEAYDLLCDEYETVCVSSKEYSLGKGSDGKYISAIQQGSRGLNRGVIRNIRRALKLADADVVWFTNTEWRLLAYLAFVPKGKKIVVTMYRNTIEDISSGSGKAKKIKLKMVKMGIERANLVVVTNPNLSICNNQIYIPDYYYRADKYDRLRKLAKRNQILCVGAMRSSKDLEGVVSHFSGTDIPVHIVGGFSDKAQFEKLNQIKGSNITIEDKRLDDNEYYQLIAESKYIIMPYKMESYRNATSGILQESIFVGSIPIAPQKLLEFNGVSGIGYQKLIDLPTSMNSLDSIGCGIENDIGRYTYEAVKKRLLENLEEISHS